MVWTSVREMGLGLILGKRSLLVQLGGLVGFG